MPPPANPIVDTMDHHGGWTKILGCKAYETSPPVYLSHLYLVPLLMVIPSEFCIDLFHHITRVPGLSCSIVFEIPHLAVLVQLRLVMDGQTDKLAMTANTTLAQHRPRKN